MHPPELKARALELIAAGVNECCVHVSVYSSHLACVIPQHGIGRKHERRIVLRPWQQDLVDVSSQFSKKSKEIVDLFIAACDRVGVFTRVSCSARGQWDVRINRRRSVALMLEHVGRKV